VRWWGTRGARFGILLVALAALLLAPIHLTPTCALVVGISGLTLLALLAFTGVRRLLNPPPDVVAESRTARAAATVEIVAATGFLAVYVSAFLAGRGLTPTASRPPDSA